MRWLTEAGRTMALIALTLSLVPITACAEEPRAPDDGVDGVPSVEETPSPPVDDSATEEEIDLTQRCDNEAMGVRIGYPEGWETNDGTVADPCSYFHPEPFDVPEATEVFDIAIQISEEPVRAGVVLEGADFGAEVISRDEITVAGREAVSIETEATGETLRPQGMRAYHYYVDLGEATLVAVTYAATGLDYERNKSVLDAMMARLEFLE